MLSSLFGDTFTMIHFPMRWLHVFFGITWIGILYYFNFIQGAFMAETDANAKSQVLQKLLPRALWWFRYGALGTFLTGLTMLSLRAHLDASGGGSAAFVSSYWINIFTGALMATFMFLNVWVIIWPKQQIVMKSAEQVAKGGAAIPEAAPSGARALVASRTNTLFSIPMIFFMVGASHLGYPITESSHVSAYYAVMILLIGGIEANAIFGKTGPMTSVKGVITSGFVLTAVLVTLITILV